MTNSTEDITATIERISDYTPFLSNGDIVKLAILAIEGDADMRQCADLAARIATLKAERSRIRNQVNDLAAELAETLARMLPSSGAAQLVSVGGNAD